MNKGKGIITPPGIASAFGSSKKAQSTMQMIAPKEFNYSSHKEYNEKINEHSEIIDSLTFRDSHVLLRFFKYEKDSKSKGGIIVEDIEYMTTEGGQIKGRIKQNPYQKRAVVVKMGHCPNPTEFTKQLTPGTIVHLPNNNYNEFHIDKSKKVDEGHGYILMHTSAIEAIEG